ncbi:inner membrane transporter RhtA [Rarobacter faecitabidus]|uniref:Inner membrane transporter RhtA n=2 Tax=Rarobacter faecitabidus TaxID=13243 RepID=A0A542ZA34_RARFA|nr:inner membrane transporter RhtA [Rarobacter faecitabidus]
MLFGATITTQLGAVTATRLFDDLGVLGTAAVRLAIAAVIIIAITRPAISAWTKSTWISVTGLGMAMAGMNASFYAAIDRIPLGIAVATELLGPLLLATLLSRKASHFVWTGLAMGGVITLGLADGVAGSLDPIGLAFAAASGACWALYIPLLARVGRVDPGVGPLGIAMGAGALVLLPFGAGGIVASLGSPSLVGWAAATALLGALLPYAMELMATRHMPSRVFSVLAAREPVIAASIGLVLLGQVLPVTAVIAIGAVVVAAVATALSGREAAIENAVSADDDLTPPEPLGRRKISEDEPAPALELAA